MKKGLIFLIGIVSFLGINTVQANTLVLSEYGDYFNEQIEFYLNHKTEFDDIISYWESNYSTDYPYYYIVYHLFNDNTYNIYLLYSNSNSSYWYNNELYSNSFISYENIVIPKNSIVLDSNGTYSKLDGGWNYSYLLSYNNSYNPIPLINNGIVYNNTKLNDNVTSDFDMIHFNSFASSVYNLSIDEFEIKENDLIPSYLSLYEGTYNPINNTYTEINLNNYEYVALSLKDYSIKEQFYTNVYVKGNYCLTPIYNYGMTEKSDYYSSYQAQACSPYYENYTIVRSYILEQDLKNKAIYYLKAYDKSKENLVKIDTSVFNITYITSENKDNPYVNINGKTYPTIPYDNLSSSSTKSEDEGYISGVSCQVGDFNCYNEYNPGNVFNDLFTKPLELLKTVWTAIVSIFAIITEFILLLPPTMQGFLYVAFGIGIILGIIKIIV